MIPRSLAALVAGIALITAGCGSDSSTSSPATDPSGSSAASSTASSSTAPSATAGSGTAAVDPGGDPSNADCPPAAGTDEVTRTFSSPPPNCLDPDATYEAIVTTNKGELIIALDPQSAPVATNNFVFLARNRYFDDTICHRIIPNFVVQCGDPDATGMGGPGYTIIDEPPAAGAYRVGSIAMAKTQLPDSAGSQFFIITGSDGAALPPEYALFGQVVDGLDTTVAEMAAAGTPGQGVPSEPIEIQSIRIFES